MLSFVVTPHLTQKLIMINVFLRTPRFSECSCIKYAVFNYFVAISGGLSMCGFSWLMTNLVNHFMLILDGSKSVIISRRKYLLCPPPKVNILTSLQVPWRISSPRHLKHYQPDSRTSEILTVQTFQLYSRVFICIKILLLQ